MGFSEADFMVGWAKEVAHQASSCRAGTSATAERPQPGPPPAVTFQWILEGFRPCPGASTHCWSGWLGHGKRG
jgi:hypothetical protein